MKTTDRGYVLTEIPGLDQIIVEPSEKSAHGVHVVLIQHDVDGQSYGLEELAALVDALREAHALALSMVNGMERSG